MQTKRWNAHTSYPATSPEEVRSDRRCADPQWRIAAGRTNRRRGFASTLLMQTHCAIAPEAAWPIASCFFIPSPFFIESCDIASFDMESFDIEVLAIESCDIAPPDWANAIDPLKANVAASTAAVKNFKSTSWYMENSGLAGVNRNA
ncbi:hypothetical protein [Paraburkholderia rhizosphaerae]|uniref:hypothetical protein n=1 Tax=Paraburkholderia rhizosphaerae TaxID=480658 RepID=UPI001AB048F2